MSTSYSRLLTLKSLFLGLLLPAAPAAADYLAASLGPNFFDSSILRYSADGDPIAEGDIPSGTAGLGFAQAVTIGPDGNIYVSHSGQSGGQILFFDPAGSPLTLAGGQPGVFATLPFDEGDETPPAPAGLAFGPNGNLYVADREGTQVRVFDGTTGEYQGDAATDLQAPTPVTFGPDGAFYVGNFNSASVVRVSEGTQSFFIAPLSSPLQTPSSLLWLQSGNLLVVDLFGNQILEYDAEGAYVGKFADIPPEIPDPLPPGANFPTNSPSSLILDEDGNLLLGVLGITPANDGALLRYDLEGNLLETVAEDIPGVGSVAFVPAADATAGDYNSDGNVNGLDYSKWKADFGKWVAKGGGADGNGNGVVDAADYAVWRDNGPVVVASAAGVPEPATALLALVGLAFTLSYRRRSSVTQR
jgi:DNA-binding beta-propeller fold protein YncE